MASSLYVTRPDLPPLEEFLPYLQQIWDSKILTNAGPFHQQLEEALCKYLGVDYISLCSNGTLGLLLAMKALNLSGEVITTPYSFVATSHALLWSGLKPVFVDIDPNTLNLDPGRVEEAITEHTTAILAVHCYGHRCDIEGLQSVADRHGIKVIYDAAHAFGVRDAQGSILRHGDLSVLSFHATKVFHTLEGGAIVCHDAQTKNRIDRLKNFGFVDETTVVEAGVNAKMTEVSSALGLLQLHRIDESIRKRRDLDALYRENLKEIPGIYCLPKGSDLAGNCAYFPVLVRPGYSLTRDALYEKLRSNGIFSRRYFFPLISSFPMYRDFPSAQVENLYHADMAANQVLCLPIFPALVSEDVLRIANIIRDG